jgi:hypothetical protein
VCGHDEGCDNLPRLGDTDPLAGNSPGGAEGEVSGRIAWRGKYDAIS